MLKIMAAIKKLVVYDVIHAYMSPTVTRIINNKAIILKGSILDRKVNINSPFTAKLKVIIYPIY